MTADREQLLQLTASEHVLDDDLHTIPELGAELRALRYELRAYVERHDREHGRQIQATEKLAADVGVNSQWRLGRQAQERVMVWLVGSNLVGWIMVGLALMALLIPKLSA